MWCGHVHVTHFLSKSQHGKIQREALSEATFMFPIGTLRDCILPSEADLWLYKKRLLLPLLLLLFSRQEIKIGGGGGRRRREEAV